MDRVILEGFSTTAGFLQRASVSFSPKLTCIIGARGTCKSTLVETIRYCLNCDPNHSRTLQGIGQPNAFDSAFGLIKFTLGAGTARASVSHQTHEGKTSLSIERDSGSEPRVYRDDVREHANLDILERFEIYSQGDLQRMADGEGDRLGLIDRPNVSKISALRKKRSHSTSALRDIGARLKTIRGEILKLESELKGAPALENQLAELRRARPKLSAELEESRSNFLKRRSALSILDDALDTRERAIEHLSQTVQYEETLNGLADRLEKLGQSELSAALSQVREIAKLLRSIRSVGANIRAMGLDGIIEALSEHYEKKDEAYYQLQRQQVEVNDSIKREDNLRRQIEHMNQQQENLSNLQDEREELLTKRARHRAEISLINETIFDLRLEQIEQINEDHGELVLLSLQVGSQSDAYVQLLSSLLSGSRIRDQHEVARDVAQRIPPSNLVDILESSDAQQLAQILDRDLGQMTRVVSHLGDHDSLYDLEAEVLEDRLAITLFDDGIAKPIETLSKGQKATALLPLILRPSPHPLVIDQPEDDLDNSFIFKSLVQTVHNLKQERQIIFVTHNANIPVLGEAEQVIVMSMANPEVANPPLIGSVDERKQEILDLLEGGAQAFEERHKRYEDLLGG